MKLELRRLKIDAEAHRADRKAEAEARRADREAEIRKMELRGPAGKTEVGGQG